VPLGSPPRPQGEGDRSGPNRGDVVASRAFANRSLWVPKMTGPPHTLRRQCSAGESDSRGDYSGIRSARPPGRSAAPSTCAMATNCVATSPQSGRNSQRRRQPAAIYSSAVPSVEVTRRHSPPAASTNHDRPIGLLADRSPSRHGAQHGRPGRNWAVVRSLHDRQTTQAVSA
jgi:hypothetical protein